MSWALQWLVGLKSLGHDVYFVEKSAYPNACYDPSKNVLGDDCSYGVREVQTLLERFDLKGRWCFVDIAGRHHGLSAERLKSLFSSADLYVDMGAHGVWAEESRGAGARVLVEGEPGFTQIKMEKKLAAGETLPEYDHYYTAGSNIGTHSSTAPTAGKEWRLVWNMVATELFQTDASEPGASFTTVMNWQSHDPIDFRGTTYGQKDVEFKKFMQLPRMADAPLEVAVSGRQVPTQELRDSGWRIRDGREATLSFDSYREYIRRSRGEFSVCKNIFVATRSGWFSDRSAAYLASGRPVVLQDTGFSAHLPCGRGLFAVSSVEQAVEAIKEINSNYSLHSNAAREIAAEYLDAKRLLRKFLDELGF